MGRVLEVDGDNAADGAGGLVHQTAGLAEEHILGILADLGDLDLVELLHVIVVVLAAQDGTDADLKGCGAGQTGAAQHIAGGVAVKAAHLAACIHNALGDAADQGRGVLGLARLRDEVGDIDIVNFVKAQGLDADDIFLIRSIPIFCITRSDRWLRREVKEKSSFISVLLRVYSKHAFAASGA